MFKSLIILTIFISFSQIFANTPEIAKESIDESFEHKIGQPSALENQERSLAGQDEENKNVKKNEEEPKLKYWRYHPEVGPKY